MEPTHRVTFATCHSQKNQPTKNQKQNLPNVEIIARKKPIKDWQMA